jgi:hypothetical protein
MKEFSFILRFFGGGGNFHDFSFQIPIPLFTSENRKKNKRSRTLKQISDKDIYQLYVNFNLYTG